MARGEQSRATLEHEGEKHEGGYEGEKREA
jgi:hypothetical protein